MTFLTNSQDWYFVVDGDATKVFHTGRGIFVLVNDAPYSAWLAQGKVPTAIDLASLGSALSNFLIRPTDATVLDAYVGSQADIVLQHLAFKILFNHENRLRAIERNLVLNGSPANLTPAQARATVKALM